jgi:FixJ family two-component response regulator
MAWALWQEEPTALVADRDPAFCQALRTAVKSLGLRAEYYDSPAELLQAADPARPGCLLVDPLLSRWSVAELFKRLADGRFHLPAIVVSDCGEVAAVVEAIRAGAINYLKKPCEEGQLADALREAIAWDAEHRQEIVDAAKIRRRLRRLTPGEREVLEMLVHGMTNQEVAAALGRSVRAIEARRAKIRRKMRAHGLADLVRIICIGTGSRL